jgi:hypothetical protein
MLVLLVVGSLIGGFSDSCDALVAAVVDGMKLAHAWSLSSIIECEPFFRHT